MVLDHSTDSVTLHWQSVFGASKYAVRYKLQADSTWTLFGSQTQETTLVVDGLSPEQIYQFQIQALRPNATVGNAWSSSIIGTTLWITGAGKTDPTTLGAPTGLGALPGDLAPSSSLRLTWTAPTGAVDGYLVQYRKKASTSWQSYFPKPLLTIVTLTGLEAQSTYEFRIQALPNADPTRFSGTGNYRYKASPWSETFEGQTEAPSTAAAPSLDFKNTAIGMREFILSITASSEARLTFVVGESDIPPTIDALGNMLGKITRNFTSAQLSREIYFSTTERFESIDGPTFVDLRNSADEVATSQAGAPGVLIPGQTYYVHAYANGQHIASHSLQTQGYPTAASVTQRITPATGDDWPADSPYYTAAEHSLGPYLIGLDAFRATKAGFAGLRDIEVRVGEVVLFPVRMYIPSSSRFSNACDLAPTTISYRINQGSIRSYGVRADQSQASERQRPGANFLFYSAKSASLNHWLDSMVQVIIKDIHTNTLVDLDCTFLGSTVKPKYISGDLTVVAE